MESFNFEILLTYNEFKVYKIEPLSSLINLNAAALEKFNLPDCRLCYVDIENRERKLLSENDYLEMFNYVSENSLPDIRVIVENLTEKNNKLKSAMRKNSKSVRPVINTNYDGGNNYDFYDPNMGKDMRNLGGINIKGSYSVKERKRIFYTKQKKEMQREEQHDLTVEVQKSKSDTFQEDEEDIYFGVKNKKSKIRKGR